MKKILLAISLFLFAQSVFSKEQLIVEVKNITKKKGKIVLAVFDNKKDLKAEKSLKTYEKDVKGIKVLFYLSDLKKGKYVIQLYQDLNQNQKCDRNFIGIPKEPVGISNNIRPKFGPPSFEEMQFEYRKTNQKVIIELFEI